MPTKNSPASTFLFPSYESRALKVLPSPLMVVDPLATNYSLSLFKTITNNGKNMNWEFMANLSFVGLAH